MIPYKVAEILFNMDWDNTKKAYKTLGFNLDSVRKAVVMDMLFNLGVNKFKMFKKMIKAIENGDYNLAAEEMIDSEWYRQVGYRSKKLVDMMRSGEKA
jgi:lysozyme